MTLAAPQRAYSQTLEFGGQSFVPLLSGALFWPAQNALLVADLHLEKKCRPLPNRASFFSAL